MNTKTVTGFAMLAVVATPFAASAQSIAEIIAKNPSLAALLAPYMAQSTSTASCAGTITKTLKKGMTDAEVATLQSMLNASADTAVATSGTGSKGMESSYFGAATKAAVIKFQNKFASEVLTPNGLTAGTGSVGAATRAKLNAMCTTATTTATTGTTTGTTTGSTSSTGLQGSAGSAQVDPTTVDTDTTIKQGRTSKVLGFKLTASDSDLNITNVKVTLNNTDASSSDRLPRYVSKVHVLMNGTEVGVADVSDFTRNTDTTYTKAIALTNAIVRKGTGNKATFHIAIDGAAALDSSDSSNKWNVKASEVRFQDATGVTLSSATSVNVTAIQVQKLSTSGDVKLTVTAGASLPVAHNEKVSTSATTKNIVLNEFKVKAEGTPVTFNKVKVALSSVGHNISKIGNTIYVMKGSQQLGSYDVSSSNALASTTGFTATVNLDADYVLAKDTTDTFQVTVDVAKIDTTSAASTFSQGDSLVATVDKSSFTGATDANGDAIYASAATVLSGSVQGNAIAFYTQGVSASNFISTIASANNGTSARSSGQTFTTTYRVKAFGQTYYIPKMAVGTSTALGATSTTGLAFKILASGNDVTASVATSTVAGSITSTANSTADNKFFIINDGEEQAFTVATTLNPNGTAGMYSVQLSQVGYTTDNTGATAVTAYTFAPVQNYRTAEANLAAN